MNIADYIFERRSTDTESAWIADILERLVWLLDDNGEEILSTMRQWIEHADLDRVRVALAFREVFLYQTRTEMVKAFDTLGSRFPELRERCDEILTEWDSEPGRQ